jgi:hypothetical protein
VTPGTVRVLVTGSRTWTDRDAVFDALDQIAERFAGSEVVLIHGACPKGADRFASEWAQTRQAITEEPHPADWNGPLGKGAGFARNVEMVESGADLCVTFIARCGCPRTPGPHGTHGAVHCANKAADAEIPIHHVRPYRAAS